MKCRNCSTDKPESEFYAVRIKNYNYICKECDREQARLLQAEYRKRIEVVDRQKEYQGAYRVGMAYSARNREYQRDYYNKKMRDASFRLNKIFGAHIYHALKADKGTKLWTECVGYSLDDLRKHIEAKFQGGMSWDNYGDWHIDHRIPKSSFFFKSMNDAAFKKCWALDNLQPLWAKDNLAKGSRMAL